MFGGGGGGVGGWVVSNGHNYDVTEWMNDVVEKSK